ncbi:hypothetical protein [Streptomyces sp. NPDC005408]
MRALPFSLACYSPSHMANWKKDVSAAEAGDIVRTFVATALPAPGP